LNNKSIRQTYPKIFKAKEAQGVGELTIVKSDSIEAYLMLTLIPDTPRMEQDESRTS
jgi:hypothetical protein